ncbi:MAG: hypothetical protein ABIE74_12840 [Pseudomonadota bacterium]
MNRKKTGLISFSVVLVAIMVTIFSFHFVSCGNSSGGNTPSTTVTLLKLTNTTAAAVIIGFVTAAAGGACADVNNLLTAEELSAAGWCTDYQAGVDGAGKCLVTLDAAGGTNASVTVPNPDNECMSGGFGIGGFATCNTTEFPTGWTQGEFTLNPIDTTQEVVDISGVNGVNYALSIELGSGWYYGTSTAITTVGPSGALNTNVGTPGVYPNGCTICTALEGDPVCPALTTAPTCQNSEICNIKRDNAPGGTVEFKVGARVDQ